MNIVKMQMDQLKPADYNPRKISKKELEKLKRSIEEFGYVELIIKNERTGNIVGGHQRYKALADLGYEEIDVVLIDVDEMQEKALNVALNKISGEWDIEKLKDVLDSIDAEDIDIELSGFDLEEVEAMLNEKQTSQEFSGSEIELEDYEDDNFDYCCPECGFYFHEK